MSKSVEKIKIPLIHLNIAVDLKASKFKTDMVYNKIFIKNEEKLNECTDKYLEEIRKLLLVKM